VVVLEAWATAVRSRDMFEVRAALEWADEVTVNTLIHVPGPEVGQSESPMTALTHMVVREGLLLLLLVCCRAALQRARPPRLRARRRATTTPTSLLPPLLLTTTN